MKKKILSLILVCMMLLSISAVATAASLYETPEPTEKEDYEFPQVLVTEGELQTLKSLDALAVGDVFIPEDSDAPMMELSDTDGSIVPFASGKLHIPVTNYTSSSEDYNESFSCDADDGNRLNIWVKNNGTNTVVLNVDWSKFFGIVNEQYDAVEIPAGGQYTMTFYYKDGRGINGNWDVNVTTLTGGSLNITVSARQYQYNG